MKNKLFSFCLIFIAFTASSQPIEKTVTHLADPKARSREHNVDFTKMTLDVRFEPKAKKVIGKVTHHFVPIQKKVDSIYFDGVDINITKAIIDNRELDFKNYGDHIIVYPPWSLVWGEKHYITFEYTANPRKGIYFIGWDDEKNISRKQIWTQGQGIDNRHWIPMYDYYNDKMITETKITFDNHYKVLSNGEKIAVKDNEDNTKTWHYKMSKPHASYLLMLAIGKYDIQHQKSKSGVTINNWYYPSNPERVEPTYRYTSEMMDFLEEETSIPYPWKEYSQIPVQDFMFGAMENTTATIFGDFYFVDSRSFLDKYYIGVNAHEMTHHWFGDYITQVDGASIWLHESFATHYQKHFERSIFGEDHYQWNRRKELTQVLRKAKENRNPIAHTHAGTERIYPKGSLVVDMLRYVLGDDQYKKGLQHYLQKHAYGSVSTHDFQYAFLEKLGINLDWFFDQWIYRGGEPEYTVSYQVDNRGKEMYTDITVEQTHYIDELVKTFKMPIEFEVHYTDGTSDKEKTWVQEKKQIVSIPNTKKKDIAFVLFDPNYHIVKTVKFEKSRQEWFYQSEKAPNMIDRYDAVLALRAYNIEEKRDHLSKIYAQEPFYSIRAEIVNQLANDDASQGLIKNAITDKHAKVRLQTIQSVKWITGDMRISFEELLRDSSYDIIAATLRKLAWQFPEQVDRYLEITEGVDGTVGENVKIARLEIGGYHKPEEYLSPLIEHISHSHEFRTRVNAAEAIQRLNKLSEKGIEYLFDAVLNPNGRLSRPCATVLRYFNEQKDYKRMIQTYYQSQEWEDWQVNILERYL